MGFCEDIKEYDEFMRIHKKNLKNNLKSEYDRFLLLYRKSVLHKTDFAGMIGLPLFFVTPLLAISITEEKPLVIIIATILLAAYFYYFVWHTITVTCCQIFELTVYESVIDEYVNAQRELEKQACDPTTHAQIDDRYKRIRRNIRSFRIVYKK